MQTQMPKYYSYGYRKIHGLAPNLDGEEWEYSIQLHRNQNGKHFDVRLKRPTEDKAFSWAMKKPPFAGVKPVLAMRTHDHNVEHMDFEGPMNTASGTGTVQLVGRGKTTVKKIDDDGIVFEIDKKDYRLRPFRGKKYMFEQVLY